MRGPHPPSVQWPRYQQWWPQWSYPVQRPKVTVKEGSLSNHRNSWFASRIEGGPPHGSGPQVEECQAFVQEVGAFARGGQRTAAVGLRSGAHGKISRGDGRQGLVLLLVPPRRAPRPHSREDPQVGHRVGSISRGGDQAGGGSEETFMVSVSAFSGWWRCVSARVGCVAVCWPAPGCTHGDFDQSWKHSGSLESIQPVSVTQGHIRHTQDECEGSCPSWTSIVESASKDKAQCASVGNLGR